MTRLKRMAIFSEMLMANPLNSEIRGLEGRHSRTLSMFFFKVHGVNRIQKKVFVLLKMKKKKRNEKHFKMRKVPLKQF